MSDDLIEIADNPETDAASVNRDRLKVDTRKWLLAKALPKIYGDRLTAEVTGEMAQDFLQIFLQRNRTGALTVSRSPTYSKATPPPELDLGS